MIVIAARAAAITTVIVALDATNLNNRRKK